MPHLDNAAAFGSRALEALSQPLIHRTGPAGRRRRDGHLPGQDPTDFFADLATAFAGRTDRAFPTQGEVAALMHRHATLLVEWWGREKEGVTDFRKHVASYLKGFPAGGEPRAAMACASSLAELKALLSQLDPDVPFPRDILGQPRGRTGTPGKVVLPQDWLEDRDTDEAPEGAELDDSGG